MIGNESIKLDSVQVEYGTVYDLSNLLDGKDVSGYTYTITVNDEYKLSVKVLGNVTVDVTFTEKTPESDESGKGSCTSSLSSAIGVLFGAFTLCAVTVIKKKEN